MTLSFAVDVPASALCTVAGVAAAAAVARAGARRRGLPIRRTVDGLFLMIAVGLLLGHVADVVLYRAPALRADWRELWPGSGGVCTLGAVLGAGVTAAAWFRAAPGGWRAHADNLVTALSLGWSIGRIGCFLDHDHLGRLTGAPFAVAMPGGPRHDLGLYEAVLSGAIFVVLTRGERRAPRPPGRALAIAAVMFGLGRFAIEHVRGDDLERLGRHSDPRFYGLTLVQYAAVALVAGGAVLWRRSRAPQRREEAPELPAARLPI